MGLTGLTRGIHRADAAIPDERRTPPRPGGGLRLVASVLVAVVVVAACQVGLTEQRDDRGVAVRNNTESILQFRTLVEGEWYEFGSVSPGDETGVVSNTALTDSLVGRDGCTIGVLVAFDPDGHEVARHDPGLCLGDLWQIDALGLSASP